MEYYRQQEAANSSCRLVVPPPADSALNTAPFESGEFLEPLPEGVLMVWNEEQDLEVGVVVELGMHALAFEYFGQRPPVEEAGHLDLMTESGLYLSRIPYKIIANEPVEEEEEPSPVPIRRALLKIGTLTTIQRNALETLIAIYTHPDA